MRSFLPADVGTRSCILLLVGLTLLVHAIKFPDFSGFWAGADQHHLLDSARAWAVFDLSPARHHYLPFYALLAAPLVWLTPWQPFMLLNIACLVACILIFVRIAARLVPRWPPSAVASCFAVGVLSGRQIFALWVVPWTTTGSAPLQFLGVLLAIRFIEQPGLARGAAWAGTVALVAGFRPSDAAILAIGTGGFVAVSLFSVAGFLDRLGMLATMLGGAVLALLPLAAAHIAIFGLSPGPYLARSAAIGFEWRLLPMRWVMLVLDTRPVLPDGAGMAVRLPWLLPGVAGLLFGLIRERGSRTRAHSLVAGTVALHWAAYLCYRDLQPAGLWRFNTVHYFKWTFPFLVLWAAQLLTGLISRRQRWRAALSCGIALPFFALKPSLTDPRHVALDRDGQHVDLADSPTALDQAILLPLIGSWQAIYLQNFSLHVAGRDFQNTLDFKVLPTPQGALLLPLRRLPMGAARLDLPPGVSLAPDAGGIAFQQGIRPGVPCAVLPQTPGCTFTPHMPPVR